MAGTQLEKRRARITEMLLLVQEFPKLRERLSESEQTSSVVHLDRALESLKCSIGREMTAFVQENGVVVFPDSPPGSLSVSVLAGGLISP